MQGTRRSFLQGAGLGTAALLTGAGAIAAPEPLPPSGSPKTTGARMKVVSLADVEDRAHKVMSEAAWAYVAGGSGPEWTLAENRRAFADYPILPHRLQGIDASTISLRTTLLGHDLAHPILVAPSGVHLFVHPAAERATAGGAGEASTLYTTSGASTLSLETIAQATTGPKWFQIYLNKDEGLNRDVLLRAKEAGYSAIVLTADALGPGSSDAFVRLGKPFPPGNTFGSYDPRFGGYGNFLDQKTALSFDDIGMIRSVTGLPVVAKGILRVQDARDAVSAGAAAVQVSNHGGRQVDGVPASVSVLSGIADGLAGTVPIILDSGIRTGGDVLRALALGATAVALARPVLYGAALAGADGVAAVLEFLRDDLRSTMLLAGVRGAADLDASWLRPRPA